MSAEKTGSKLLAERVPHDIPSRLAEMEPGLMFEVALLHEQLRNRKNRQQGLYLLAGLEVQSDSARSTGEWWHLTLSPVASPTSQKNQGNA